MAPMSHLDHRMNRIVRLCQVAPTVPAGKVGYDQECLDLSYTDNSSFLPILETLLSETYGVVK